MRGSGRGTLGIGRVCTRRMSGWALGVEREGGYLIDDGHASYAVADN